MRAPRACLGTARRCSFDVSCAVEGRGLPCVPLAHVLLPLLATLAGPKDPPC